MDTFASLALATEQPEPCLLERKPHNRNDYIISKKMFKHIIIQSFFQIIVTLVFIFDGYLYKKNKINLALGENFLPEYKDSLDDKAGFFIDFKYNDLNSSFIF